MRRASSHLRLSDSRPVQPVAKPIICSPYEEPDSHWTYDKNTGEATRVALRRPGGYYYKTELTGVQADLFAEEEWDDLPLVNALRDDVRRWREADYRGASNTTKQLLRHWAGQDLLRPLFFCQREAVETLIYLSEMLLGGRSRSTGFQKFQLDEADLNRLLRGERPSWPTKSEDYFPTLADIPADASLMPLQRMACKMATGSGKTIVMAMLIAWAFCNRKSSPNSPEFPNGILVCCPNLTVKERLQVLRPEAPGNYYDYFDLVPGPLRDGLMSGKVLIENWHSFAEESPHKEGDRSYAVVDKGAESNEDLARRVLRDLHDRMPIMVLNDEGHHCWRPRPVPEAAPTEKLTGEEKKAIEEEVNEARVWLAGLDRINNSLPNGQPGILRCIDLSATPFYIKGSNYPEGLPFPWIVSDFGLMDAIESGLVKIPRLPVGDDERRKDEYGRPDPKYFRLWRRIVEDAPSGQKKAGGKPKPEYAYEAAEGALLQIAGQWVERFELIQDAQPGQESIPPVLIVVCDNTEIADVFFRKISGESEEQIVTEADVEAELGDDDSDDVAEAEEEETPAKKGKKPQTRTVYGKSSVFPHFSNTKDRKYTIRIDTRLLAAAESEEGGSKRDAAEALRKVVATVGKRGEPGEFVRCVVSVSMLTEGWDANNVTHILGVRAFGSQLLCEQVVGRGLRRLNYDTEWDEEEEKNLLPAEFVDVYGIPFSVIPYKGRAVKDKAPEDKPSFRVYGDIEREEYEIRFPVVEGYVFELTRPSITCDLDAIDPIPISSKLEPIKTSMALTTGIAEGAFKPGSVVKEQDRSKFYSQTHLQEIIFSATRQIVNDLLAGGTDGDRRARVLRLQSRHQLFPQVLELVDRFVAEKVKYNGVDPRELGLERYMNLLVSQIRDSIRPDEAAGEPPLLPILNRYSPVSSTAKVGFTTRCPVQETVKSQINLVVAHSDWEHQAARILEEMDDVDSYARNEKLYLTIGYTYMGEKHDYIPDFVVRMKNRVQILLEIKGYEDFEVQREEQKRTGARRWVDAVNNLGDFGRWEFLVCRELPKLRGSLIDSAGIAAATGVEARAS